MLAELKDLGQKGLFSPAEIKQIIKKRTAFETTLVRRVPKKTDYLRYAAYEMSLEALRRKRVTRLSMLFSLIPCPPPPPSNENKELHKAPPSISDYALTRRQFQIFERALKKFKSDVSLWLEYLRVAQRAHAHALAGRIAARAVQLHPRTPALYVLAAAHELAHNGGSGMGAARALMLRGLRLNAGRADMWREYVRLEMGFVEAVRRRWDVLGISLDAAAAASASASPSASSDPDQDRDRDQGGPTLMMLSERVDKKMMEEEEAATMIGDDDEARRAIMDGAIVRQVIDSATKGEHSARMMAVVPAPHAQFLSPRKYCLEVSSHLIGGGMASLFIL